MLKSPTQVKEENYNFLFSYFYINCIFNFTKKCVYLGSNCFPHIRNLSLCPPLSNRYMKSPVSLLLALILFSAPCVSAYSDVNDLTFSISGLINPEESIDNLIQLSKEQKTKNIDLAISTLIYGQQLSEKYGCEEMGYKVQFQHSLYLLNKGENRQSEQMILAILPYYQRNHFPWQEATLYNRLGHIYSMAAEFDKAKVYLKKAHDILVKREKKGGLIFTYYFLADVLASTGSYAEALEYCYKSLALAQKEKLRSTEFFPSLSIGKIFLSFKDYETAEFYCNKALAFRDQMNNEMFLTKPLNKLGIIAFERGEYEKSNAYFTESLSILETFGNHFDYAETYYYLGKLAQKRKHISEAFCYLEASKQASLKKISIREERKADIGLADLFMATEEYDESIRIAQSVLLWAQAHKDYEFMYQSADMLATCSKQKGQFSKAYYYRTIHQMAKDSVLNTEKANHISSTRLENQYRIQELAQKEQLKEQREDYNEQLEKNTLTLKTLLGAFSLFFILSLLLIYLNYLRKKAHKELTSRNEKLHVTEQDLANKNRALQQYIESNLQLENFAYMASHDLKAPLNNILSFSNLLAKSSYEKLSLRERDFINFIIDGAGNMQALIEGLLNFSQVDSQKLQLEYLRPSEILERVQEHLHLEIEEKRPEITFEDLPQALFADRMKLYQLFLNLFSNALKFAKADEILRIQVASKEYTDHWHFTVSDSGIGIDKKFQERIFIIFKRLHTQDQIKGTGIGLALCKKIVEQHQGEIWVESQEGEGSSFHFTLKKFALPKYAHMEPSAQLSFSS